MKYIVFACLLLAACDKPVTAKQYVDSCVEDTGNSSDWCRNKLIEEVNKSPVSPTLAKRKLENFDSERAANDQ